MRIRITHDTVYRYSTPVRALIQVLRMSPLHHEGQFVARWDVRAEGDLRLKRREDWYGNTVHALSMAGPVNEICLRATGEVETEDTSGVMRRTVERFPPALFLRGTRLTEPDAELAAFAADTVSGISDPLERMHALMGALHSRMAFDTGATDVVTTAGEAFKSGHGVCQDFTHIFLAAARGLGIPARYVSGYLYKPDEEEQEATHAWTEAHIPGLGWTAFDPTNGICTTDGYVRVAVGLDYLDCAPVRGSFKGATVENMSVHLKITSAARSRT
jgi:transglutaminase-like putative cysteine protease